MPHPPELTLLLHQALELRMEHLLGLWREEGWREEPEALHRMRVASRRVRAVLELVDPARYSGYPGHVRRLRRLTRALGRTRELDVHALTLASLGTDPSSRAATEHLLEFLDRKRRKARKTAARELEGLSLATLTRLLADPEPEEPAPPADLPRAVWACLEPRLRPVDAGVPPLLRQEDPAALHALRIQVKRLRYTLEVLESAFPIPLEKWLGHLKSLQDALGQHHDQTLLETLLWRVHEGLTARDRPLLAGGVLDLLGAVAEGRRMHYERFRSLGKAHMDGLLFFHLRRALDARGAGAP